jgi:hypothetical protein
MKQDNVEVSKAKTAGMLCIVAGGLNIFSTIMMALMLPTLADKMPGQFADIPGWFLTAVFVPTLIISGLAIVGGVIATRLTSYGWAMAGAICSILCVWFVGIFAIIYLVKGKKAFEKNIIEKTAAAPPG